MKKISLLLMIVICVVPCLHAREVPDRAFTIFPLPANDTGTANFSFLQTILKDKRIVLLGEQSHEEGAVCEAKVRLVRFLHEEMGFGMLSMESGLFDNDRAGQQLATTSYENSSLRESIFPIWSETKEFQPLIRYLHEQAAGAHPLLLTGFDCQEGTIFQREFLPALKQELGHRLILSEAQEINLDAVISSGPELLIGSPADSALFFSTTATIRYALEQSGGKGVAGNTALLRQTLVSWLAMIRYEMDELQDRPAIVQNPRDRQMAINLVFLAYRYPDKKIICWGASYHLARELMSIESSAITQAAVKRLDSLLKNDEPTDIGLKGAVPMGQLLADRFGDSLYSMAFSSYDGAFGLAGGRPISLSAIGTPESSLEARLAKMQVQDAYVDFSKQSQDETFYASILGNVPMLAPWTRMFDGLFFIRTSRPASALEPTAMTTPEPVSRSAPSGNVTVPDRNMKVLTDAQTGEGIGYAAIALMRGAEGVQTNARGEFVFRVAAGLEDKVILSSIGYKTDTLTVQEFLSRDRFQLNTDQVLLDGVSVNAKSLSAKEIVKKALKKIRQNYSQEPARQELFYRQTQLHEDTVVFNEEASVWVDFPDGFHSGGQADKRLKGALLQFRNTTGNSRLNKWSGVGSLWLMYTHNMILEKSNALHRNAFYTYTKEGITELDGREVYRIGFSCKRPMAYTTGFGYPAPLSASGTFYIDAENYALVRTEVFIRRKPIISKKNPGRVTDPWIHYLSEIYKPYKGRYYLYAARQLHYSKQRQAGSDTGLRFLDINELLSTGINVQRDIPLQLPLSEIKAQKIPDDPEFWHTHNFQVADHYQELYRMFEKL